ncbi:MAG: glutamine--fructose-6-phosphate transaminase (isomerizing) [Patescibacteria group bacterium]
MCGIVGYIGPKKALPVLIEGLKRLEYRGYDSAGVALVYHHKIFFEKTKGKISDLEKLTRKKNLPGCLGIGHTRWATHGEPNNKNAHPHFDCHKKISVVHNGIIENYAHLKELLKKEGHRFSSDTDSEVLAHLIEKYYSPGNLEKAVQKALRQVEGTYGLAVICAEENEKLVAARNGSPLVLGLGKNEYYIGSDVSALLDYTKRVIYLGDQEMVVLKPSGYKIFNLKNKALNKKVEKVDWDLAQLEKADFSHYMLKEIFEQQETIHNAYRGRINAKEGTLRLGGLMPILKYLPKITRIVITACGTSWHSGLIGEYVLEEMTGLPVEVEYASEFRYRRPVIDDKTLVIVISQSGETADTLAALREAKKRGAKTMGIVNVVGSTIARETGAGVYIHAGPEIGVASTKAFTSQITALILFALYLSQRRGQAHKKRNTEILKALEKIPFQVKKTLSLSEKIRKLAKNFLRTNNFLYLGRGYNFPVALEGALKLKEISYIHAEGYPAAEMKHGPIALIDEKMPVVVMATGNSNIYEKIMSNIAEVKARRGIVIAIASEGDKKIKKLVDYVIYIPKTEELLTPLLSVIPLQLLAYHLAVLRGCHVDQPRNLAKSVTVE